MSINGFIIDSPEALVISAGNIYQNITAKSGSIDLSGSSIAIKGGWSLYDLISIPSGSELSIELVDARLDGDMIGMSLGASKEESASATEYKFGDSFEIDETNFAITIPAKVVTGSVLISGLKESATATGLDATQFFVDTTDPAKTVIKFENTLAGKTVSPVYQVERTGCEIYTVKNTSMPKSASVVLKFPVYNNEGDDAAITHYAQMTIFKANITQKFNIGGQYKSASEFSMSIKGVDGRRPDKKIFDIVFIPVNQ